MEVHNFYCNYGSINIKKAWNRPTAKVFNEYKGDLLNIKGIDNYEIYVCGSFLVTDKDCWDIDIILTNEKNEINLINLGEIFKQSHEIAFYKYNILIDIQYQKIFTDCNYILNLDSFEERLLELEKWKNKTTDNYIFMNEVYKNGKLFWKSDYAKMVYENVYYRNKPLFSPKRYEKFLNKQYKYPIALKTK